MTPEQIEAIRQRAENDANEFLDAYHFGSDDVLSHLTGVIVAAVRREIDALPAENARLRHVARECECISLRNEDGTVDDMQCAWKVEDNRERLRTLGPAWLATVSANMSAWRRDK